MSGPTTPVHTPPSTHPHSPPPLQRAARGSHVQQLQDLGASPILPVQPFAPSATPPAPLSPSAGRRVFELLAQRGNEAPTAIGGRSELAAQIDAAARILMNLEYEPSPLR